MQNQHQPASLLIYNLSLAKTNTTQSQAEIYILTSRNKNTKMAPILVEGAVQSSESVEKKLK